MFDIFSFYVILSFSLITLFLTAFARRSNFFFWIISFTFFLISCLTYDFNSFSSDLNRLTNPDQLLHLSSNSSDYLFYIPFLYLSTLLSFKVVVFMYQAISIVLVFSADYFFYLYFKRTYLSSLSLGCIAFSYLSLLGVYSLFGQLRFGLFCSYLLFFACFLLYSRSSSLTYKYSSTLLAIPLPLLHFHSFISLLIPFLIFLCAQIFDFTPIRFNSLVTKKFLNIPLITFFSVSLFFAFIPLLPALLPQLASLFTGIVNAINVQLLYHISEVSSSISSLSMIWLLILYALNVFLFYRNSLLVSLNSFTTAFIITLSLSLPIALTYVYSRVFYLYAYIFLILYSSYLSSFTLRRAILTLFLLFFYIRFDSFFILM